MCFPGGRGRDLRSDWARRSGQTGSVNSSIGLVLHEARVPDRLVDVPPGPLGVPIDVAEIAAFVVPV